LEVKDYRTKITEVQSVLSRVTVGQLNKADSFEFIKVSNLTTDLSERVSVANDFLAYTDDEQFAIRKDVIMIGKSAKKLLESENLDLSSKDKKLFKHTIEKLKELTDFAPNWVILLISLSLGLGTMVGWKRIVKTIGEKIGKQHLTYAQGASSELVAAGTISLSTWLGLPVSTTQVLSSGVAGSMVASKGIKNLQGKTIRNIFIAWALTLPVTILLAGVLFLLFRAIL
jgi:PiT family inorganic phosphate transporter